MVTRVLCVCTLICRWHPQDAVPIQLLALRDELRGRAFDDPGTWWPAQPDVVGGRDRLGGGTWCATAVADGVVAVVLNRPERRVAAAGAPSRGVLPLLAASVGTGWAHHVDVTPMAGFNLVLLTPAAMTWWSWDGTCLRRTDLAEGTHWFTPRGRSAELPDGRWASGRALTDGASADTAGAWPDWSGYLAEQHSTTDPLALFVRVEHGADVYETVFGQFIALRPGALRLDHVRDPVVPQPWTVSHWTVDGTGRARQR